jgi:multiple sugar transport system substrate-binding protein
VALDTALAQFLAGEISREDTMKQITDRWNEITDKEGRDKQRTAYAASLNIRR